MSLETAQSIVSFAGLDRVREALQVDMYMEEMLVFWVVGWSWVI